MRVLWITDMWPQRFRPDSGRAVFDLARALGGRVRIHVRTPRYTAAVLPPIGWLRLYRGQPAWERFDGVWVERIAAPASPWGFYLILQEFSMRAALLRGMRARFRRMRIDLVHAHNGYPAGPVGRLAADALGVPALLTLHGSDTLLLPRIPHLRERIRQTVASYDRVVAVAPAVAERASAMRSEVVPWIPNGVDVDAIRSIVPASEVLPPASVLFAGKLERWKGADVLAEAWPRVEAAVPDVWLSVVGDGAERARLRRAGRRVRIAGRLAWEDLLRTIAEHRVVCVPSRNEGWPGVCLEALACGRPVVGSDIPGIRDIVTEGCGVLVPPEDPEALAHGIIHALRAQWFPKDLRARAEMFRWDSAAERYHEVYRDMTGLR
jgi:glycosyltransferase involved in cell wall biosynthesis